MYSNKKELQNLPDYLFNYLTNEYGKKNIAKEDSDKINSYAKANGMKLKTKVFNKKGRGYTKIIYDIKII